MTRAGRRLLAITILALAVGFMAGLRAATTFGGSHHRWMAPPVPANLASLGPVSPATTYRYEPPTISAGASTPVAAPAAVPAVAMAARAASAQAGQPLTGWATWWATFGPGDYAAAGPDLRAALGPDWQGSRVRICAASCVTATLTTSCRCIDRRGRPTLFDLSLSLFRVLDPRGGNGTTDPGYIEVEVRP